MLLHTKIHIWIILYYSSLLDLPELMYIVEVPTVKADGVDDAATGFYLSKFYI